MNKFIIGAFGLGLMAATFFYTVGTQVFNTPKFSNGTYVSVTRGYFKGCEGTIETYSLGFKSYTVRLTVPCSPEVIRITEEYLE